MLYGGDVKVTIELIVYVEGRGTNEEEVIQSAENQAQAMDIEDLIEQLIYGYGVKHKAGELTHLREVA